MLSSVSTASSAVSTFSRNCSHRSSSRSLRPPLRTLSLRRSCSALRLDRWSSSSSVRALEAPQTVDTDAARLAGIEIVYRRLPVLAGAPTKATIAATGEDITALPNDAMPPRPLLRLKTRLVAEIQNWLTFVRAPIFFSSLAISLLYLTVLSFDGSFLAWIKAHHYSDAFIAGMRGIGVVTGLLGTLVMPLLEKKIGLVRAGTWSILCVGASASIAESSLTFWLCSVPRSLRSSRPSLLSSSSRRRRESEDRH